MNILPKIPVKQVLVAALWVSILVAVGTTLNYLLSGGTKPIQLLYFVASGIVGKGAFDGAGHTLRHMAVLGGILHIVVSMIWAFLFFSLSLRFSFLSKDWRVVGCLYGVVIWAAMVFVVIPVSRTPPIELELKTAVVDIVLLILCGGLPISFLIQRHRTKHRSLDENKNVNLHF